MIMIDTQSGVEVARAYQNWRTAQYVEENSSPVLMAHWRRVTRKRRRAFIRAAEKLAATMVEQKYHAMEGS